MCQFPLFHIVYGFMLLLPTDSKKEFFNDRQRLLGSGSNVKCGHKYRALWCVEVFDNFLLALSLELRQGSLYMKLCEIKTLNLALGSSIFSVTALSGIRFTRTAIYLSCTFQFFAIQPAVAHVYVKNLSLLCCVCDSCIRFSHLASRFQILYQRYIFNLFVVCCSKSKFPELNSISRISPSNRIKYII